MTSAGDGSSEGHCYGDVMITLVRRVAAAISMAGLVATFFRLRGTGGTPPRSGGWREVTDDDLT